jgi:hypothetical protein
MQKNTGSSNLTRALSILVASAFALGIGASAVEAQTPPASYYGVAGAGDTIEAKHDGVTCATATAGADGFWSLRVGTGGTCGIFDGGTVTFSRNGAETGATETFHPGGVPASISGGVSVGGGVLKPAPAPPALLPTDSTFSGKAPASGSSALLVTTKESTPETIKIALSSTGCQVQSLAVLREGSWIVYIEGAPAAVNSKFPAALPQTSPFFARC